MIDDDEILYLDVTLSDDAPETQLTTVRNEGGSLYVIARLGIYHKGKAVALLRQLYVRPYARREGQARRLMQAAYKLAIGSKCVAISLVLAKNSPDVAALYESEGFVLAYEYDDGDRLLTRSLIK